MSGSGASGGRGPIDGGGQRRRLVAFSEAGDGVAPPFLAGRGAVVSDVLRAAERVRARWLEAGGAPQAHAMARVVQGAPGAGKTALLGHIGERAGQGESPDATPRLPVRLSVDDLSRPRGIAGRIAAQLPSAGPAGHRAAIARAVARPLDGEASGGGPALNPPFQGVVLALVDDAHLADPGSPAAHAMRALHRGPHALPVLPVFAGRGDLRQRFGREGIGLGPFAGPECFHVLAGLEPVESDALLEGWLADFGVRAGTDELALWQAALRHDAQGWPMHVHDFLAPLAGALAELPRPRSLSGVGLDAVRMAAARRRLRRHARMFGHEGGLIWQGRAGVARLMARLRAAGPQSRAGLAETIRSAFGEEGAWRRELVAAGFLQQAPDPRGAGLGAWSCPVPGLDSLAAADGLPLHLEAAAGDPGRVRAALRADPAAVRRVDAMGRTALHLAAEGRWGAAADELVKAGADPHAKDALGATPAGAWPERAWPPGGAPARRGGRTAKPAKAGGPPAAAARKGDRVPRPAGLDLFGAPASVQVNHCRTPACANFGVPARHEPQRPGPSPGRDALYKLHSTNKGRSPSIKCKSCGGNPPLKSNRGIVEEAVRLAESGGLLTLEETASCPNPNCANHGRPIARHRKGAYRRQGRTPDGEGWRYRCVVCGRRFSVSDPVRLHGRNKDLAADVFRLVANRAPVRAALRELDVGSPNGYYAVLRFIHRRCRSHAGAVDRALIDGRLRLPEELQVEAATQEHSVHWSPRLDGRNAVLTACGAVEPESGYILALSVNFDAGADPFAVQRDAARSGDYRLPEPFRRHARHWLVGDELGSGRKLGARAAKADREALLRWIEAQYVRAERPGDVEGVGLPDGGALPKLARGVQVHLPYTAHAHWLLLRRMLEGAGVRRLQVGLGVNPMLRSAFLAAFAEAVRDGGAHAFLVRHAPCETDAERGERNAQAARELAEWRALLPPGERNGGADGDRAAARLLLAERLGAAGRPEGRGDGPWIAHPLPASLSEAGKEVCWITPRDDVGVGREADLHLGAGTAGVEAAFAEARRAFSALNAPAEASGAVAPHDPAMLEAYLTLFRTVHNFIRVGEDGRTPATRLGLAGSPMGHEDVLWRDGRKARPKGGAQRR